MPIFGLGVFQMSNPGAAHGGSDVIPGATTEAVNTAVDMGYTLLDCAQVFFLTESHYLLRYISGAHQRIPA
jgi:diketogulonate reductase-like aldo/keto reductase